MNQQRPLDGDISRNGTVEGIEAHKVTNTNPKTNTENIRSSKYKPNNSHKTE
jgi:hypothetical protein